MNGLPLRERVCLINIKDLIIVLLFLVSCRNEVDKSPAILETLEGSYKLEAIRGYEELRIEPLSNTSLNISQYRLMVIPSRATFTYLVEIDDSLSYKVFNHSNKGYIYHSREYDVQKVDALVKSLELDSEEYVLPCEGSADGTLYVLEVNSPKLTKWFVRLSPQYCNVEQNQKITQLIDYIRHECYNLPDSTYVRMR